MNFQPPDNEDPRDDEQRHFDNLRAVFEEQAEPMGFDLTRIKLAVPEPWAEYKDDDTGHRWGGFLAGVEWAQRQARASLAPVQHADKPEDIQFTKAPCVKCGKLTIMAVCSACDEASQPADKDGVLSDRQISAGARALSDQHASECGVNKEDHWKLYSETYIDDARVALHAALATATPEQKGEADA